MKSSKFNYFIPHKGKYIFFNGMSKRFFFVSEKNYATFLDVVSHPDTNSYAQRYAPFLERMKREGFVLDKYTDETELLRKKFEAQRNEDLYMLMILPTYRCNLSCWYCIQEHQNVNLTDEMVVRIKRHIKKYLTESGVKRFRLSWFGGEPLIAYKHLVDITSYAQSFCKKHHITYFSDVTTNSLLLTPDRIVELGNIGVRMFQITIDGCREKHNQVKRNKDNTAFDKALSNILEIVKNIPNVRCVLRINYSAETLEPEKIVNDINELIPAEYRQRIEISPHRIWQLDEASISNNEIDKLDSMVQNESYSLGALDRGLCYVDYKHFNCIFPNGNVDKCENESLESLKGVLTETGDIVWNGVHPFESYQTLSDKSECAQCKHVAFCMGPCPKRRNEMAQNSGKITCMYPDKDRIIQDVIVRYCENMSKCQL